MIHKNQLHPWLFFVFILVAACNGTQEKKATLPPPATIQDPSGYVLPPDVRLQVANAIASSLQNRTESPDKVTVSGMTLSQGIADFYQQRNYQPAWNDAEALSQLIVALEEIRFDGLDPSEYSLQELKQKYAMLPNMNSITERANLDLIASQACMTALIHLRMGRLDPYQIESQWNFSSPALDTRLGLTLFEQALENKKLGDLFQRARPQQPVYTDLRNGLRHLYSIEARGGWKPIPAGETLKLGMNDADRIPLLRARLIAAGNLAADQAGGSLFDARLQSAVVQFQQEQNLDADGAVGKQTLAVLNVPVAQRINQVKANLERSRWLLHEVNGDFVWVDIAGYKIYLFKAGKPVWSARVQVGKPYRSTPIFKSRITYITLNPTWTIPPTIFKEDILPKIRSNPEYLQENRLSVLDSQGNVLDPATIDWNKPGNILLREEAGSLNPLGKVVIRFPNTHAIYIHDTPSKGNFSRGQRAFSSGCIRAERPLELVELLFDDPERWNQETLAEAIQSGETRDVGFRKQIPILLTYSTVGVTDDGRLSYRQDIYERDPSLIAALDHHEPRN